MLDAGLMLNNAFLKGLFNALPSPTFVVDSDVRFLLWNDAGGALVGKDAGKVYRKRGGEVLHCIHSTESPDGCGHAPACRGCVVRNVVGEAFQGEAVRRRRTMLELAEAGVVTKIPVLVTASMFASDGNRYAVLIIETIRELIQLQALIPICACCKKICNDRNEWESVEQYIARNIIDIDFSHGFCPDCAEAFRRECRKAQAEELSQSGQAGDAV